MYISVRTWRDLEDGHLYNAGDPFPHNRAEVPEKRIHELLGSENKAGFPLIKEVCEEVKEEPPKEPETPKRASGRRKKTT